MRYTFTRQELKTKKAADFQEGDTVQTGKYLICIRYGDYHHPSLRTTVELYDEFRVVGSTPGVRGGRPYYIHDFITRR